MPHQTLIDALLAQARQQPDAVYLHQPMDRRMHTWTWAQVLDQVRRMAAVLAARGHPPGSRIAIVSKNCAHWLMADLAILLAGHVSVPLYQNQSGEVTRYVLEHSGAVLVFTGKLDEPERVDAALPAGLPRITFPYPGRLAGEDWDTLVAAHAPLPLATLPRQDDIATILYTSGTTGNPKGVVMRFRQIDAALKAGLKQFTLTPADRMLSYLPLSHVAERALVEVGSLYTGASLWFVESLDTFAADLQACQPTAFFAVPRLWTRFQMGVLAKLPQAKLDRMLRIPVVATLVRRKVRKALGLAKAHSVMSGAASMAPALLDWYARLGITIHEVYGMTETFGQATTTALAEARAGSVGKPFEGIELKIDPANGELLLRGPTLMDGYWREPQKTAEAMTPDGWYRSGDMGQIGADGALRIVGRVREQFKTAKGKFVSPSPIEGLLMENPWLEQVCVMGSDLAQPLAIAVLSDIGKAQPRDAVTRALEALVADVNRRLDAHERLAKLLVSDDAWTIENGLLTPTLKLKRTSMEARYQPLLEELLDRPGVVVWQHPDGQPAVPRMAA
jgi:long-chain acyl-CoA synthetase